MQRTPVPIIVRPRACPTLPGSFEVKVTVRGEHTGGVLASIEETLQPGAFVTPHTHANDVWVYVLSGTVGVLVPGSASATACDAREQERATGSPVASWIPSHRPWSPSSGYATVKFDPVQCD